MDQITRRNVIGVGIATGAMLLSGVRPARAASPTFKDFLDFLDAYIVKNHDEIISAGASRGGGEKWLQTELAIWILKQDKTYDLSREQPVYKNKQLTVDFQFNGPYKENNNLPVTANTFLVEMKCQSLYSKKLKDLMDDDAKKLRTEVLDPRYQHYARRYIVGLTLQGGQQDLKEYEFLQKFLQPATRNDTKSGSKSSDRAAWVYYQEIT